MSSEPDSAAEQLAGEDDELLEPLVATGRLTPGLHLVATPIGNMRDITLRALDTLRIADLVACEDTRHSGMLLKHHGISARLISLNEHNEAHRIPQLLEHIRQGGSIALISDAGMPTVSDPGQRLSGAVVAAGFHAPLPGSPPPPSISAVFSPIKKGRAPPF
jgi:16S rRNA (cytidine1402-2'-O)-methyltransferase